MEHYAGIENAVRQIALPPSMLAFAHVPLNEEETALDLLHTCFIHQQEVVIRRHLLSIEAYRALRSRAPEAKEQLDMALTLAQSIRELSVLNPLPRQAAMLFDAALEHGLHVDFVSRAIRLRKLTPPDPVQQRWPWALRLRAFAASLSNATASASARSARSRRSRTIFSRLSLSPGRRRCRQLWPDLEAKDPRASFDMTLSRLRKMIDVDGALVLANGRLQLDRRLVRWDLASSRLPAAHACGGRIDSDATVVVGLIERLAALCVCPLFGGEAASAAGLPVRQKLLMAWMQAVHDAGERLESRSLWAAAIALY